MKIQVLAVALSGALFSLSAHAGKNSLAVQPISGGYRIIPAAGGTPLITNTSVTAGAASGEALIQDMFKGPGPANKSLDLVSTRSVPWSSIARAASRAAPYAIAGMFLYDIWKGVRTKSDGDSWEQDKGLPEEDVPAWSCRINEITGVGSGPKAACADAVQRYNSRYSSVQESGTALHGCVSTYTFSLGSGAGVGPYDVMQNVAIALRGNANSAWCGVSSSTKISSITASESIQKLCPLLPDGTRGTKGFDGKCPSGRYEPISDDEARVLFENNAPKGEARNTVEELLKRDVEFAPAPEIKVKGENKIESEPRVKTEVDPQGNTKTTTTKDVYNIKYDGNTYTWNVTTVTVNSDGSTSEETKPDEEVSPPQDPTMPERPKLYEQKYKDGIQGVWDKEMAGIHNTPIFQFLKSMNPGLGGSDCPKWTFPSGDFMGLKLAGGDISVPCSVWFALKAIIIVSALLLARRLIFGG